MDTIAGTNIILVVVLVALLLIRWDLIEIKNELRKLNKRKESEDVNDK